MLFTAHQEPTNAGDLVGDTANPSASDVQKVFEMSAANSFYSNKISNKRCVCLGCTLLVSANDRTIERTNVFVKCQLSLCNRYSLQDCSALKKKS